MVPFGKTLVTSAFFTFYILTNLAAAETTALPEQKLQSQATIPLSQTDQPMVEIRQDKDGFQLFRNGEPYYIKGAGGGTRFIEAARAAGANSLRTWSSKDIGTILDQSALNRMTVLMGIWLSHRPSDYLDENYKNQIIARVQNLLDRYKHHPALLMWSLGNEINLNGKDSPEAWQFINALAQMIQQQDRHHPVITVISFRSSTLNTIARYAPDLDAVGINAYGALSEVRAMVDSSEYTGPYLITEWGVKGHWEVERTQWGRPIEPVSQTKADLYHQFYVQDILKNRDRCLGSYVFLWGQKQERTPTWYSMFIETIPGTDLNGLACATVDAMEYNWSGSWPLNRTPMVTAMTVNGITAHDNVSLYVGQEMLAQVTAQDPEQERLTYLWELLEEPVKLGAGGSWEKRPATVGRVLLTETPEIRIQTPGRTGIYRLFVYVLDENGRVGTANIPFQVDAYQARKE